MVLLFLLILSLKILSRAKPAASEETSKTGDSKKSKTKDYLPTLDNLLDIRDYSGAVTLLKFQRNTGQAGPENALWLAYSAFHNGDYQTSRKVSVYFIYTQIINFIINCKEYEDMTKSETCHPDVWANLACCYFMLGRYEDAKKAAQQGKVYS